MYNELYIHLAERSILYSEQFGLVFGIVEIVHEIANGFMEIKYTIGVFADLSEGFDTVNQYISIEKLDMYVAKDRTLKCFKCYLPHKKTVHST